ncbi:MAG: hypothetical protein AAFU77_08865 [Myxococcota bacterium]
MLFIACNPAPTRLSFTIPTTSALSVVNLDLYAPTVEVQVIETGFSTTTSFQAGNNVIDVQLPRDEVVRVRVTLRRSSMVLAQAQQSINASTDQTLTFVFDFDSFPDVDQDGVDDFSEMLRGRNPDAPDTCAEDCGSFAVCCLDTCIDTLEFGFNARKCGGCSLWCQLDEGCIDGRCVQQEITPPTDQRTATGFLIDTFAGGRNFAAIRDRDGIRNIDVFTLSNGQVERYRSLDAQLPTTMSQASAGAVTEGWLALSNNTGTAIYRDVDGEWTFTQLLGEGGQSLAFDEQTLAVATVFNGMFAIELYSREQTSWTVNERIFTDVPVDSMDLRNNLLALTAPGDRDTQPARVLIFERDDETGSWTPIGDETGDSPVFGSFADVVIIPDGSRGIFDTSTSETLVVVNAPNADLTDTERGTVRRRAGRFDVYSVIGSFVFSPVPWYGVSPKTEAGLRGFSPISPYDAVFVETDKVFVTGFDANPPTLLSFPPSRTFTDTTEDTVVVSTDDEYLFFPRASLVSFPDGQ